MLVYDPFCFFTFPHFSLSAFITYLNYISLIFCSFSAEFLSFWWQLAKSQILLIFKRSTFNINCNLNINCSLQNVGSPSGYSCFQRNLAQPVGYTFLILFPEFEICYILTLRSATSVRDLNKGRSRNHESRYRLSSVSNKDGCGLTCLSLVRSSNSETPASEKLSYSRLLNFS